MIHIKDNDSELTRSVPDKTCHDNLDRGSVRHMAHIRLAPNRTLL